jgi:transposase
VKARKQGKGESGRAVREAAELDTLERINLNAAGLDIGAEEIYACVPDGRDVETSVRVFGTYTPDLRALADWLARCRIDTIAMESTGVYWIPAFEILEARGFKVYLVNARQVKNVSGRKTDVLDCQWIQQLHTYGLLSNSFRPEGEICALRAYLRHRGNLIRYRSGHVQHIHKALQQMNVQLMQTVSDMTGVTGMRIIRAIVAGERDPQVLAQQRDPRCAKSAEEIARALTGNYRTEHVFALRQAVELYDFYTQQIAACDAEVERQFSVMESQVDVEAHPLPPKVSKSRSKNAPAFDARTQMYRVSGVDLTRINGIDEALAQEITAEIGVDMSAWPTAKHFASWLRLAPRNDVSGGKLLRSQTGKTGNRAAQAFRMAAQAVQRGDSALGAFYRRMKSKYGAAQATTATAHKIARIVYHMLKHKEEYMDPGGTYYEEQYRKRAIKNLERKAARLGMRVVAAAT